MNGIWCVIGLHMLWKWTTFGRSLGMQLSFIN